jgi:ATP-dependent Clp protease ATP-binding subunit ClpB
MTSNLGSQFLLDGIDENGEIQNYAVEMVKNELRTHFRPEFLNRLDETIMFKPLTKENIGGIVELLMKDLNKRLAEQQISIRLTDEARDYCIEQAYDPVYGARPLKRYLQQNVETLAAKIILRSEIHEGSTIIIDRDEHGLTGRVSEAIIVEEE